MLNILLTINQARIVEFVKNNMTMLLIAGGAVVVIMIGLIVFLLIRGMGEEEDEEEEPESKAEIKAAKAQAKAAKAQAKADAKLAKTQAKAAKAKAEPKPQTEVEPSAEPEVETEVETAEPEPTPQTEVEPSPEPKVKTNAQIKVEAKLAKAKVKLAKARAKAKAKSKKSKKKPQKSYGSSTSDYHLITGRILQVDSSGTSVLLAATKLECLPVTIPVNVAIALVKRSKKCLLVDFDINRDAIAKVFDIDIAKKPPTKFKPQKTDFKNLQLWPAHNVAHGITNIELWIEKARKKYDYILLNAPYLDTMENNAEILAASSCGFIFTDDINQTTHLAKLMKASGCKLIGCVQIADSKHTKHAKHTG